MVIYAINLHPPYLKKTQNYYEIIENIPFINKQLSQPLYSAYIQPFSSQKKWCYGQKSSRDWLLLKDTNSYQTVELNLGSIFFLYKAYIPGDWYRLIELSFMVFKVERDYLISWISQAIK